MPVITTYICDYCGDTFKPTYSPQNQICLSSRGVGIGRVQFEMGDCICYNCILRGLKGAIVQVRERRDNG